MSTCGILGLVIYCITIFKMASIYELADRYETAINGSKQYHWTQLITRWRCRMQNGRLCLIFFVRLKYPQSKSIHERSNEITELCCKFTWHHLGLYCRRPVIASSCIFPPIWVRMLLNCHFRRGKPSQNHCPFQYFCFKFIFSLILGFHLTAKPQSDIWSQFRFKFALHHCFFFLSEA